MSLANPRVLLIGPSFFGYERDIVCALERRNCSVDLIDERPSNSSVVKAALRVSGSLATSATEHYFKQIWKTIGANKYDILLVIKGEVTPRWFIELFSSANPSARRVFYSYDSVENNRNATRLFDLFHERYSFDRNDVNSDHRLIYLPLFYTSEFKASTARRNTDACFIGTLHGNRYSIVLNATSLLNSRDLFFYTQARWYLYLRRLFLKDERRIDLRLVSTKPMSRADIVSSFQDSRAVLDIQRKRQSGLTMRTFEALASGCALITTNPSIRHEPFFDPSRILIIPGTADSRTPYLVRDFVRRLPDRAGSIDGFSEYSIDSWAAKLLHTR